MTILSGTAHLVRFLTRLLVRIVVILAVVAATIVLVRAFDSRRKPDLKPWHNVPLESEFRAETFEGTTFDDYLAVEEGTFRELDEKVYAAGGPDGRRTLNRFHRGSPAHPENLGTNWNRTFEMTPDGPPVGGILLVHGLTDSPYSVRRIAEIFRDRGFYVLAPRMPGHGTAPSGLLTATWRDWMAVMRLAVVRVRDVVGDGVPLYAGGYSNGGALAVKYTLDSLEDEKLETPARVFLFSPAIGITKFAVFATWHKALSFLPWFEKFKWESIYLEYDPYKYNSFPKNAGHQSYALAEATWAQIQEMSGRRALGELPPAIAFQSVVDATIVTPSLVDRLFDSIETAGSELVLFDINRSSGLQPFLKHNADGFLAMLEKREDLPFSLTVITGEDEPAGRVVALRRGIGAPELGEREHLGFSWPEGVYSLSHVAIPFTPDDPVYGDSPGGESGGPTLGSLRPQGEKGVTTVPIGMLMRLRYNPFFPYMEERIIAFCPDCREVP
jgi:alpha-beta hydrolase superfamily lysophospholipase